MRVSKGFQSKFSPIIDVIIPAHNEGENIGYVIDDIDVHLVRSVIVCDNNSSDNTAAVAEKHGAIVVTEPNMGYGNACLKGMKYISKLSADELPDIIVFLDGDYSDDPTYIDRLIAPIVDEGMDLVLGNRVNKLSEQNSLTPTQRFGNWLSSKLIYYLYGYQYQDLGPFRAIRYEQLLCANMKDKNFGWTVELQVKAAKNSWEVKEIDVPYRMRKAGKSKVSGTIKGVLSAGYKIIFTIIKLYIE